MMDTLRDIMCLPQIHITVCTDLDIYVCLIPKHSRLNIVQANNPLLSSHQTLYGFYHLVIARLVCHLANGIPGYIKSRFQNKGTDNDTGNGIQNRISHFCSQYTDKAAHRGQCVGTMVPRIRLQSAGLNAHRRVNGIPVHPLFGNDRYQGSSQRKRCGHGDAFALRTRDDRLQPPVTDPDACGGQD